MCAVCLWGRCGCGPRQLRFFKEKEEEKIRIKGVDYYYKSKTKTWRCPYCTTKPKPKSGRFVHLLAHAEDVAIHGEDYKIMGQHAALAKVLSPPFPDVMMCFKYFRLFAELCGWTMFVNKMWVTFWWLDEFLCMWLSMLGIFVFLNLFAMICLSVLKVQVLQWSHICCKSSYVWRFSHENLSAMICF